MERKKLSRPGSLVGWEVRLGWLKYSNFVFCSSCLLTLVSSGVIEKYCGIIGVITFFFINYFLVLFIYEYPIKFGKALVVFYILSIILIPVLFDELFPFWDVLVDRDEALEIAIGRMLSCKYPYSELTSMGNPITPMPGMLILTSPFYLLAKVEYINIIAILFLVIIIYRKYDLDNLYKFIILIALSPVVWHELLLQGDLIANSIIVAGIILLMADSKDDVSWKFILLTIIYGVSLSTRLNFLLTFPFVALFFAYNSNKKNIIYILSSILVFIIITLPFYLYSPGEFTPLFTMNYIAGNRENIFIFLTAIFSVNLLLFWIYFRSNVNQSTGRLFMFLTLSQLSVLLIPAIEYFTEGINPLYLFKERYGLFPLFFALVWGIDVLNKKSRNEISINNNYKHDDISSSEIFLWHY